LLRVVSKSSTGKFTVKIDRWLSVIVLVAALFATAPACACNVPVFRYALERWKPDLYQAVLFHEGPLLSELTELVEQVRKLDDRGHSLANVQLQTVDLSRNPDDASMALWKAQSGATAPWLVVRYPPALALEQALWSANADPTNIRLLLESPARKELARRLLEGQSTVWIVIESGDAEEDRAVVDRLEKELKQLESTVKLPDESAQPGGVLTLPEGQGESVLSRIPLRVAFSVLRVSREDAAEQGFLASILQTDEGLATETGPIVLPVFGRGRALQAFPGADLDAQMIREAVEFLCGACSCSVKAANPGMDLLLTAHWDAELEGQPATVEPSPQSVTLVPIPAGGQSTDQVSIFSVPVPAVTSSVPGLSLVIVGLAGLVLLVSIVVIAFIAKRGERS
jgi:hypothetical protein